MKRTAVVLAALLGLFFSSFAQAQDQTGQTGGTMGGQMINQGQMMNQGQMSPYGPRHLGMMAGLMGGSMVATSDGGVVLFVGQKLMKFDKNLKLVKEVEVKIDIAALQKTMQEMWQNCPQCWKRRMGPRGGRMMGPGGGQMMPPQEQQPKK
jgi:hypothetical protein